MKILSELCEFIDLECFSAVPCMLDCFMFDYFASGSFDFLFLAILGLSCYSLLEALPTSVPAAGGFWGPAFSPFGHEPAHHFPEVLD